MHANLQTHGSFRVTPFALWCDAILGNDENCGDDLNTSAEAGNLPFNLHLFRRSKPFQGQKKNVCHALIARPRRVAVFTPRHHYAAANADCGDNHGLDQGQIRLAGASTEDLISIPAIRERCLPNHRTE
jgi:hypothetical protein